MLRHILIYSQDIALISATLTLAQRNNINGSSTRFFNRTYAEYENGFGSQSSLYWIGLKSLHQLTQNNTCSARFILQDTNNILYSEEYIGIVVDIASTGYLIHINGFTGDALGSMTASDGGTFVMSCGGHLGGFWDEWGCQIEAGINFSPPSLFKWMDVTELTTIQLSSSEFWLSCYSN